MPELFRAGFETGDFSEFVSGATPDGVVETNGVASVVSTDPAFGSFHMRAQTLGVDPWWERASARHNVGSIAALDIYARTYVKFISVPGLTQSYTHALSLDDSGERFCIAGIDGNRFWKIRLSDGTTHLDAVSTQVAQLGQWYCIELHVFRDPVNGFIELFVDGQLVVSMTDVDTHIGTGLLHVFAGCTIGGGNTPFAAETHVDAVVVADEYIGPELPPQLVAVTYSSEPIDVAADINGTPIASQSTIEVESGATIIVTVPSQVDDLNFTHYLVNGVEQTANPLTLQVTENITIIAIYTTAPPPQPTGLMLSIVTSATGILLIGSSLK